ncbi:hypothetical protein [Dietzia sp. PP-33]|jgi:hypothetical protein|uniref:hypothetical protein n=1 Tax=Dietzia sp. PP-33 TaxID=2957500 RepID=UPI0029BE1F2D|nr:hypothetical protein [Dietzia sp. PP-33]MDX2356622.1 hypothetical protein [Dietzia sp. PP-33]
MSERRDDDPTPDRRGPQDEVDPRTDPAHTRDLQVTGDPLGLGGTPDPDAPSRRPRPRIVSLLGEFFKMSRTTAILLVTFVLVAILYSMVKSEPVLSVRSPAPQATTSESEPGTSTDPSTSPSPSEQATETSVPTVTTPSAPTGGTTSDPSSEGRQATTSAPGGPGDQTQQTQQTQQSPQDVQPQPQQQPQQVPEGAAAVPTGGDQAEQ